MTRAGVRLIKAAHYAGKVIYETEPWPLNILSAYIHPAMHGVWLISERILIFFHATLPLFTKSVLMKGLPLCNFEV